MPRAGSPPPPPGGRPAGPPLPMNIGEVADPPFARVPDPSTVFEIRAQRFSTLAEKHELAGYLKFLAQLAGAQHRIVPGLPEVELPPPDAILTAREHTMPPLSIGKWRPDAVSDATFSALLASIVVPDASPSTVEALDKTRKGSEEWRRNLMMAVLLDEVPESEVAEHVLAAAAIQVQFTRAAARLEADKLVRVADGACPVCGGMPVASMIVGWSNSANTRFCCCSVCSTLWHAVRAKCLLCGEDKGVAYHGIEGGSETVRAETCDSCGGYIKLMQQINEPAIEPFADDVATLALDMVLQRERWRRGSANPFLLGY